MVIYNRLDENSSFSVYSSVYLNVYKQKFDFSIFDFWFQRKCDWKMFLNIKIFLLEFWDFSQFYKRNEAAGRAKNEEQDSAWERNKIHRIN